MDRRDSISDSVKNSEVEEFDQTQQLNQWTIPAIRSSKIYKKGMFDLITQNNIKTVEHSICLDQKENVLELLSRNELNKYLNSKYKFLHIGCIQIAFKPLTLSGLNASILACLRDARCLDFQQSLMGIAETSLCHGPVYFDVYPNLHLSLSDRNLFKAVQLQIDTQGYNFLPGSETISVIYRIHYKVLTTLCPNAIIRKETGKTLVIDSNYLTTNIAVNRLIKWEEINFPTTWSIPSAVTPEPIVNNRLDQINQTPEGDIEVSFSSRRTSRLSLSRSSSSRLPSRIPYEIHVPSTRNSVSEYSQTSIGEPSLRGIRMSNQQIPHGVYDDNRTRNEEPRNEEPRETSPTASDMIFHM